MIGIGRRADAVVGHVDHRVAALAGLAPRDTADARRPGSADDRVTVEVGVADRGGDAVLASPTTLPAAAAAPSDPWEEFERRPLGW